MELQSSEIALETRIQPPAPRTVATCVVVTAASLLVSQEPKKEEGRSVVGEGRARSDGSRVKTVQSVWKGRVRNDPDPKRAAVLATDTYSSPSGITLHHDHRYEVIATYDNPTPRNVDAMASLWMYVRADSE